MWKHASLSRVLFPSPDCFPMLEAERVPFDRLARVSRKALESEVRIDFVQDFSFQRFHFFFLFFSPVIAAIYYNRDIIAKV